MPDLVHKFDGIRTNQKARPVWRHCDLHFTEWGAADVEIKVPSGENTELKRSPFKDWSRSVYSHTCYAYCLWFLTCLFLPFQSIHLHFFQNLSWFLLCWLWLTHGSCVGPQNKMGHPARMQVPVLSARGIWIGSENVTCGMMTRGMTNLEIEWSSCSALM